LSQQIILNFNTKSRGMLNITSDIEKFVASCNKKVGLCNLFLQHTSASLIVCENADPDVQYDLEQFMQKIAPNGDASYLHSAEGSDDMPAHIRTVLTQTSLTIPIKGGRLALGTWQGIFLWEHRASSHSRRLVITVS